MKLELPYPWMTVAFTPNDIIINCHESQEAAQTFAASHFNDWVLDIRECIKELDDAHAMLFGSVFDFDELCVYNPAYLGAYVSTDEARRAMWRCMGYLIDREHVMGLGYPVDRCYGAWTFRTGNLYGTAAYESENYIWRVVDIDAAQVL